MLVWDIVDMFYKKDISQRRRETQREALCRSTTQRASCYSQMGKQNNIITREILILAIWFMEQKTILSWCKTNIRDEPTRPEPGMTLFDGLVLKCVKRYELETFTLHSF